ncbi:hypothetical protein [uncultured Planococcus sp.]|uniref:hypothetical protein n=1 Tax=Planococcus donghaensis TaxID=414778 RepID=UPI0026125A61|nr:hypothetical protein [uncultured Planococcus sp.]
MKLFTKFAFWLPFFSFLLILFELFAQPAKSLVFTVIDPVFGHIRSMLPETMNSPSFLLPLHFLLAVVYGSAIDVLIKKLQELPNNE